jgi:Ulp1 family protease
MAKVGRTPAAGGEEGWISTRGAAPAAAAAAAAAAAPADAFRTYASADDDDGEAANDVLSATQRAQLSGSARSVKPLGDAQREAQRGARASESGGASEARAGAAAAPAVRLPLDGLFLRSFSASGPEAAKRVAVEFRPDGIEFAFRGPGGKAERVAVPVAAIDTVGLPALERPFFDVLLFLRAEQTEAHLLTQARRALGEHGRQREPFGDSPRLLLRWGTLEAGIAAAIDAIGRWPCFVASLSAGGASKTVGAGGFFRIVRHPSAARLATLPSGVAVPARADFTKDFMNAREELLQGRAGVAHAGAVAPPLALGAATATAPTASTSPYFRAGGAAAGGILAGLAAGSAGTAKLPMFVPGAHTPALAPLLRAGSGAAVVRPARPALQGLAAPPPTALAARSPAAPDAGHAALRANIDEIAALPPLQPLFR